MVCIQDCEGAEVIFCKINVPQFVIIYICIDNVKPPLSVLETQTGDLIVLVLTT